MKVRKKRDKPGGKDFWGFRSWLGRMDLMGLNEGPAPHAGPRDEDAHRHVPVILGGNDHGIDVPAGGDLADIDIGITSFAGALGGVFSIVVVGRLSGLVEPPTGHITNSDNLHAGNFKPPGKTPEFLQVRAL